MRKLDLVFLAGGIIQNQPKCLIKSLSGKTIIEEILTIFSQINYKEYNLEIKNRFLMYPKNYLEDFTKIIENFNKNLKESNLTINLIQAGDSLQKTIENFIKKYEIPVNENDSYICFIATDIPLITLEAVEDIIKRFCLLEGDLFYPFVSKEVYKVQFGKLTKRRTFVKLGKDSFCGTGIIIIKSSIFLSLWEKFKSIIENRKNPLKIIKLLKSNYSFDNWSIIKILIGKMTVLELEEKINNLLNIKTQGLLTNYATLAFNIDILQDLEDYYSLVQKYKNNNIS